MFGYVLLAETPGQALLHENVRRGEQGTALLTSDHYAARHALNSPAAPRNRIVGRRGHRQVVALGVESAAAERRLPLKEWLTK